MAGVISALGRSGSAALIDGGRMARFAWQIGRVSLRPPLRARAFVREVYDGGVRSLAIVCASGMAVGMVLGLTGYRTLVRFVIIIFELGTLISMFAQAFIASGLDLHELLKVPKDTYPFFMAGSASISGNLYGCL